jgi:acyl-CoA synthetase (AMP-forming)/AMP-acid ligase II
MKALQLTSFLARRDHTLGTVMEQLAGIHGTRSLVQDSEGLRLDYRQAAKRVARWAGGIRAMVEPGERVVVATGNGYQMFLLCLAASRAGAIAVPVNADMRSEEIAHVVEDSGARMVIHSVTEVDGAEPLAVAEPAAPGDIAALFYTSGTTGKPKGVELTHRALLGQLAVGALWQPALHRDEIVVSLPVAHIMGFAALLGFAHAAIPVYFLPRFNPVKVLDAIEQRRATMFVGVPAMYRMMLEAGAADRDLTSVRVWMSGADAMPTELARTFKRFGATATLPLVGPVGEAAFAEGYGMVELAGGVAAKVSPPLLGVGLGEGVGVSLPGYRFRVVDDEGAEVAPGVVGELLVSGPGVLKGYWGDAAATADVVTDDGWVRTGDLARRGPFGTVTFAGRKKDVIKHGGYSVYATEVERALEEHPDVLEAAVVGIPDERLGEIPVAVVRLGGRADLATLGLDAWAADRLADYKVPKRFVAVDELPRTGTRKVQKRELLKLFT